MTTVQLNNLVNAYISLYASYDEIVGIPDLDEKTVRLIRDAHTVCVRHNAEPLTKSLKGGKL